MTMASLTRALTPERITVLFWRTLEPEEIPSPDEPAMSNHSERDFFAANERLRNALLKIRRSSTAIRSSPRNCSCLRTSCPAAGGA